MVVNARKPLILNGEMSEWSIEHAWKTIPATLTEGHQNTSSRNRFNDFPPQNASRCEPVNVSICRQLRAHLTQFLHSSRFHLFAYTVVSLSVRPSPRWTASGWRNDNPAAPQRVNLDTAPSHAGCDDSGRRRPPQRPDSPEHRFGPITPTGAAAPRPECSRLRERGGSARRRRPGTKSAGGSSR